jgi:hypothetical protein
MDEFSHTYTITPLVLASVFVLAVVLLAGWARIRREKAATTALIIALVCATVGPLVWIGATTSWKIVFLSGSWVVSLVLLLLGVFLTIRPRKA